ncbi:TIM barrel protein [Flavobacteriaceae bacterium]|nr:TIM barrel protein [Flavobacteriaceae bacterium]MDA7808088.1 TIM barrel protein [Flavobacteriaceae bacterium]MDA9851214.1 TIM barrel protein [Flavobacteriaceae bacterium]MDC3240860.1 TIM barrel protein [Flavobacteriaceae bacterium]
MNRRNFTKASMLGGIGLASTPLWAASNATTAAYKYNLHYAPHLGMFRHHAGEDPIDQLNFMADQGFTAFEDNDMRNREVGLQEKMAVTMKQRGLRMGVFVAHQIYWQKPNLASGDAALRTEFLEYIKKAIPVAKRVNAKWMTVVPGHVDLRQNMAYQTAHVIESLKQASALLEPHGLVMVLEPLNFRNHPGLFLSESPQAYEICKAVDSPSCKILFDIYHQQIQEGNLIPNIEQCWDEIGYFQIGDNPGRKEPTTGEINYTNVFKYIHGRGYQGILGMEHGNFNSGKEGELAVIKAYQKVDQFL